MKTKSNKEKKSKMIYDGKEFNNIDEMVEYMEKESNITESVQDYHRHNKRGEVPKVKVNCLYIIIAFSLGVAIASPFINTLFN